MPILAHVAIATSFTSSKLRTSCGFRISDLPTALDLTHAVPRRIYLRHYFTQDYTPGAIMQVTHVKVYPTTQGILRAYADITIDNSLCLRKLRLLRNPNGYMLCMPNGQTDGSFRGMASPAANDETLKLIQDAVVAEYKRVTGPRTRSRRRVWLPT